jgi:hypothetical protein
MENFQPPEYKCTCPTCQQVFYSNHLNRRYCSKSCKIYTNNRKTRDVRQTQKSINAILSKNDSILKEHSTIAILMRTDLLQQGFNFGYYTHKLDGKSGVQWLAIYDYAYQFTDATKTQVKIIKV